jgi:hypothetical protein
MSLRVHQLQCASQLFVDRRHIGLDLVVILPGGWMGRTMQEFERFVCLPNVVIDKVFYLSSVAFFWQGPVGGDELFNICKREEGGLNPANSADMARVLTVKQAVDGLHRTPVLGQRTVPFLAVCVPAVGEHSASPHYGFRFEHDRERIVKGTQFYLGPLSEKHTRDSGGVVFERKDVH